MENEKECDHGHIGQKYDERRGTGNGAFLCFECEKTVPELLAEATRRARAEAFREVEEMANKIVGCHSCDDNGNGCDNAIALLQILTRLEALKGKEV